MRLESWLYYDLQGSRTLEGRIYGHPVMKDGSALTVHDVTLNLTERKAVTLTGELELGQSYMERWGTQLAFPLGDK